MKKIIALLLIFAMCLSFVACENNKKKDDDDDDVKTTKVNKDICSSCFKDMIGEWFDFVYNEETKTNELKIIKVTEDGKLTIDENEYKIKFENCGKNYHNWGCAYDADGNQVYTIDNNCSDENNSNMLIFYGTEGHRDYSCRSMSEYTVIEVTEENWQDYFSPNINETFEESLSLKVYRDTWGEFTGGRIYRTFYLKDYEKYAYGTTLSIEYSYEYGDVYCEFDVDNETVTKYDFTSKEEKIETISMTLGLWDTPEEALNVERGGFSLSKEEMLAGNSKDSWCSNPTEILRMKGLLVIRNDV